MISTPISVKLGIFLIFIKTSQAHTVLMQFLEKHQSQNRNHTVILFLTLFFSLCRATGGNSKPETVGRVCYWPSSLLRRHTLWETATGQRSLEPAAWGLPETHPHQEFYGGEGNKTYLKKTHTQGFENLISVMSKQLHYIFSNIAEGLVTMGDNSDNSDFALFIHNYIHYISIHNTTRDLFPLILKLWFVCKKG